MCVTNRLVTKLHESPEKPACFQNAVKVGRAKSARFQGAIVVPFEDFRGTCLVFEDSDFAGKARRTYEFMVMHCLAGRMETRWFE